MENLGNGGAPISRQEADEYLARFASSHKSTDIKADMFNFDCINTAMSAPGAVYLRFYYGLDESGQIRLIIIPADADGNDIYTLLDGSSAIMQFGTPCPPKCNLR